MDAKWLHKQFQTHPKRSKAELAEFLGVGAPAISKILAGTRQIKASKFMAMQRFFEMAGDPSARPHSQDRRSSSFSEKESEWREAPSVFQKDVAGFSRTKRVYAVKDKAMAPGLSPGMAVVVDVMDRSPSPAGFFLLSDGVGEIIRHCAVIEGEGASPVIKITAAQKDVPAQEKPLETLSLIGRVIAKLDYI